MSTIDPDEPPALDAVALAVRHRRRRNGWLGIAIIGLAASAVWSHWRAPADAAAWDGRAGVTVERVIDGDTIVVTAAGLAAETVRLRGVDAPDAGAPFAVESQRYLAARLLASPGESRRAVVLKFDALDRRDADGRLWAYVNLGDSDCLNVDVVRDGMAFVDRRSKTILQSTLEPLETQARTRGTGLWKTTGDAGQPAWRRAWLEKVRSRANR